MSELYFKGKEFVYNHHLTVPYRPLMPHAAKSVGSVRMDGNLLIQGDNLHALKALMPLYAGKIDCIYIDPPYNTGNENWSYNDNVNSPLMREWLNSNPVNKDDMLRHDKWLCMMYPRLVLLAQLLSATGTLLVSIDDNEAHHLRSILDEIIGEQFFIGVICWKTRNTDNRVKTKLSIDHEYVLAYSRGTGLRGRIIDRSDFTNPDRDPRGPYVTDPLTGKATAEERPNLHYPIINPKTRDRYEPDPSRGWITDKPGFDALLRDNRIWWPPNPKEGKPRKKRFLSEVEERMPVSSFWIDIKGQSGADEVDKILGERKFAFPKSVEFMTRLLDLATTKDSIILDSFAGSGTTAHAVLSLNKRDGGSRRFILVETEDYANDVTAERLRRVAKGYKFEGTTRDELYREPLTFASLKRADKILDHVASIENLDGYRFDTIRKEVSDGVLIVTGEKKVTDRTAGLGGEFTYCTLGKPIDLDSLLTGTELPHYDALGAWLFHTATGKALAPSAVIPKDYYLGETVDYHVWLIYRPKLEFLRSPASALTLSFAERIVEAKKGKRHLVFAPAKFVPNKTLLPMGVEFAPLPYALFRVEKA